jgi:hypothetical protein
MPEHCYQLLTPPHHRFVALVLDYNYCHHGFFWAFLLVKFCTGMLLLTVVRAASCSHIWSSKPTFGLMLCQDTGHLVPESFSVIRFPYSIRTGT